MTPKEQQLADTLTCPNCGAKTFDNIYDNAALGFRCDCGLQFNFVPMLKHVQIVRDPAPHILAYAEVEALPAIKRLVEHFRKEPAKEPLLKRVLSCFRRRV